jgi:hypothetical protein
MLVSLNNAMLYHKPDHNVKLSIIIKEMKEINATSYRWKHLMEYVVFLGIKITVVLDVTPYNLIVR